MRALEMDLPFLGVCRGAQVLNILMGGQLVLDIPTELSLGDRVEHRPVPASAPGMPRPSQSHSISVVETSRLASILAPVSLNLVNSRHHQGITHQMLAPGLEAVAFSIEDGLIEAIESNTHRWVIGVQWHPERPEDYYVYKPCQPLFRSFIDACRLTPFYRNLN
jgi:putative glutamine amidotransferase